MLDFGLAKAIDPKEAPTATATGGGVVMGTRLYGPGAGGRSAGGPPGGYLGLRRGAVRVAGRASDLCAGDDAETLAAVAGDHPPWNKLPAETPAEIRRLLRRCLDREIRNRLRDVGEARIAIQNLGKEPEVTVSAAAPLGASTTRRKHSRVAVGAAVVLLLTAAGWRLATIRQPPTPELKLRQLTTNTIENPVASPAISPDGKYLAYSDLQGMHIRNIDSGEGRTVPQPEGLHGERCCLVGPLVSRQHKASWSFPGSPDRSSPRGWYPLWATASRSAGGCRRLGCLAGWLYDRIHKRMPAGWITAKSG